MHTLHGPFTDETRAFYARHGYKAPAVALSRYQAEQAPPELDVVAVIGNPIVVDDFPFRAEKDDFVLWVGRINPDKGPHRAIAAAREAGVRLVLAGPVQPGNEDFFAERGGAAHRRRPGGVRRRGRGREVRPVRGAPARS